MINISDIIERNKKRPEPIEIAKIRENIINTFSKLEFIEDVHKYFLPQKDGTKIELPSVSATAHKFEPFVDWDEKCAAKALKLGIPTEQLKREWFEHNHLATNTGTGVHLYGEMYMHFIQGHPEEICDVIKPQYEEGYLFPHSPKEAAVMHYWEDLFKVDDIFPVMPEARVYMGINDKFKVKQPYAGTFDILLAMKYQGKWKLLLHDYKTNADIYSDYAKKWNDTLLEPFTDFINEPKSIYTIQLNLYQLCLEQLGYEIIDRRLIWLKDNETYEKISLPNITDRLLKVI
jgi:hypothetical protein